MAKVESPTKDETPLALEPEPKTERVLTKTLEVAEADIRLSAVGMLRAEEVDLQNSAAGLIVAGKEAKIERSGARTIMVAGPIEMEQAGAGTLLSLGDVRIDKGGAAVLAARSATVGEGGFIGLAVTPSLRLEAGAKVLAGPREVAIISVVAAVAAMLSVLLVRLNGLARRPPR